MKRNWLVSGLRTALGTFCLLALAAGAPTCMAARNVDVTLINRSTGERLVTYRHDGKLYVAGRPGDRYAIEIHNRRAERVLTVVSVDGINVLSGATANVRQAGYVFDGGESDTVNGWRKSLDDVAQFVFTALSGSYAARTGRPSNVGVIGVAVFLEKSAPLPEALPAPVPWGLGSAEARRESEAPAAPAAKSDAVSSAGESRRSASLMKEKPEQLGTGHGAREYAPVGTTEFERRSDVPEQIVTIYYDSRENLIARGVIPVARPLGPRPFPDDYGFVPDPRG